MTFDPVCFDFDGVLVRSRRADRSFLWSAALEADLGVPPELKASLFAQPHWQEIICGREAFRDRLSRLFAAIGRPDDVDAFIAYWLAKDLDWREDALAVARDLKRKGAKLYVATNQDRIRASHIRALPLIKELFDGVVASSDLGAAKPEAAFFERAARHFAAGAAPVLVDDDARNVRAAVQAGWSGAHFDPDLDPDATAESLRALLL